MAHLGEPNFIEINELTNAETIAANRRGHITAEQVTRIRRMRAQLQASARHGRSGALSLFAVVVVMTSIGGYLLSRGDSLTAVIAAWLISMGLIALFVARIYWKQAQRAQQAIKYTEADLAEPRVTVGEGKVVWGRGANRAYMYVMQVGTHQLHVTADALPLPPGRYRCWYLAESGWLLSAQPGAELEFVAAQTSQIAQQHGFNAADLEANRAGTLSKRQRAYLWRSGMLRGAFGFFCLVLIPVLLTLPPGVVARRPLADTWLMFIPLVLLLLGVAAACFISAREQILDARATHPIRVAGGTLHIRFERGYRTIRVYYELGGKTLSISEAMRLRYAYNSLIPSAQYRVYYRERTNSVLSLEAMGPPQVKRRNSGK